MRRKPPQIALSLVAGTAAAAAFDLAVAPARTSAFVMWGLLLALAVRKLLERAKGYLMRSKKLSEEEAFRLIQRQSMDLRKSMREIAEAVLLAGDLEERAEKQRG